ncbi:MAG: hypothetical protein HY841_06910 [Bacteroidetes bacterium]|nr:hypothetical protein [Bacteroidota bacterium]
MLKLLPPKKNLRIILCFSFLITCLVFSSCHTHRKCNGKKAIMTPMGPM